MFDDLEKTCSAILEKTCSAITFGEIVFGATIGEIIFDDFGEIMFGDLEKCGRRSYGDCVLEFAMKQHSARRP